jgi:hypothetical protein
VPGLLQPVAALDEVDQSSQLTLDRQKNIQVVVNSRRDWRSGIALGLWCYAIPGRTTLFCTPCQATRWSAWQTSNNHPAV